MYQLAHAGADDGPSVRGHRPRSRAARAGRFQAHPYTGLQCMRARLTITLGPGYRSERMNELLSDPTALQTSSRTSLVRLGRCIGINIPIPAGLSNRKADPIRPLNLIRRCRVTESAGDTKEAPLMTKGAMSRFRLAGSPPICRRASARRTPLVELDVPPADDALRSDLGQLTEHPEPELIAVAGLAVVFHRHSE